MHDPMVVAFEIPRPWPERDGMRRSSEKRWEFRFAHVPWWKFWRGWRRFWVVAGRRWYWPPLVTVWHCEPGGQDALTVCRRRAQRGDGSWMYRGLWRLHVHHWRVQVIPIRKLHRFLFERCEECGRRFPWGYAPVAHQWDQPRGRWWRVTRRAFHHECSSLDHLRRVYEYRADIIKSLILELRVRTDESEQQIVERLTGHETPLASAIAMGDSFPLSNHLQRLMGYERDDDYHLVKKQEAV